MTATTETPPADNSPCVLVRSDLRPSTYQVLAAYAKEHGTDVGTVLSHLADRAVDPDVRTARAVAKHRTAAIITDATLERIRAMNAEKISDNQIAATLGLAQSTVTKRRAQMGLLPPKARVGGRRAS